MKVLFLSSDYVSKGWGRSAYLHRLYKLSQALQEQGVQTEFLGLPDLPIARPQLLQPLNFPIMLRKFSGYDFVHAGGYAAYVAVCLKSLIKPRIIYDVHGDILSEAQLQQSASHNNLNTYWVMQARICQKIAYRGSDFFLAVSQPLEERLIREQKVSSQNIGLVRNGVDLQLFNQSSPTHTDSRFVVAYAGGFQCWQGLDNLIDAFEVLRDEKIQLKIIGFSKEQSALRKSILRRLGNSVELADRMSQKELVLNLSTANLLVIPRSRHRAIEVAFPTKFSEYLAMGKPVIVNDVDETANLVRQYSCGLVSEPNPKALAATILAASKLPMGEMMQMGKNGRLLSEKEFSWQVIGKKYFDLLTKWSDRDL
jgi:glycosyltransferase involved in cell wall biosynthesis